MTARTSNPWIVCPAPNPRARLRLFCFPYAGGGIPAFRGWSEDLPANLEISLVQLPGRGTRWKEAAYTRMMSLVDALAPALLPELNLPFAFYGHSMGAIIAFEITRRLRRKAAPLPAGLFISGARAPHRFATDTPIHALPTPEFLAGLRRFGGAPQSALESPELIELLLPMLRADFAVCETYAYSDEPPLDRPLWIYGGTQDHVAPRADLEAWKQHTTASVSVRVFSGGHFFIDSARALFLRALAEDLAHLVRQL